MRGAQFNPLPKMRAKQANLKLRRLKKFMKIRDKYVKQRWEYVEWLVGLLDFGHSFWPS